MARIQLFIQCADAAGHDFALDASKLIVAPGDDFNLYTFQFGAVRTGGAGDDSDYLYMIDVNGDGIFDTPWRPLSERSYSDYSLYVSGNQYPTRRVGLQVWDTKCNVVRTALLDATLAAPSAPSAASPDFPGPLAGHDFLQADVDDLTLASGAGTLAGTALSFLGTRPADTDNGRLTCSYTRAGIDAKNHAISGEEAAFMISGQNAYPDPKGAKKPAHYMRLWISGIKDRTGEKGNLSPIDVSAARINSSSYATDQQEDLQSQYQFTNDRNCALANVSVTTKDKNPNCDGGSGGKGYSVTVAADFNCPHLKAVAPWGAKNAIRLGDRGTGHFSCKVPVADVCHVVHECQQNDTWTDNGQKCCHNSPCGGECDCQVNPPSSPPSNPGPGTSPGSSGGSGPGGPVITNPPPPPAAPRPPR